MNQVQDQASAVHAVAALVQFPNGLDSGILLFLHADMRLPENFAALVRSTLSKPGVVAGAFAFRLDASIESRSSPMPSTYLSLHYHAVFSTRRRELAIAGSWRTRLFEYLE